MRLGLKILGLAAVLPALPATASPCTDSVQGRVIWDNQAKTNWSAGNLKALCEGAETSTEPGACFARVTTGGVNWGGGTSWNPSNALDLCRATRNASATIGCFQAQIARRVHWRQAIPACRAVPGAASSPPPVTGPVLAQPRAPAAPPPASKPGAPAASPTLSASKASQYLAASRSPVKSVSGFDVSNQRNQPTIPLAGGEASALAAFRLRFENGDHKVKRISLLRFAGTVQAALNDNDGNDPFSASGRYLEFNQGRVQTITADCRGECSIPLALERDKVALLAGFSFERPRGDYNVRDVSVRLVPELGFAEVTFVDDQGRDLRVGSGSLSPTRARDARDYNVVLQYVVVDRSMVKAFHRATGDRTRVKGPFAGVDVRPAPQSPSGGGLQMQQPVMALQTKAGWSSPRAGVPHCALVHFKLRFGNRDHHLLDLGVNLDRIDEVFLFQDNNRDDPVEWTVDCAELGS